MPDLRVESPDTADLARRTVAFGHALPNEVRAALKARGTDAVRKLASGLRSGTFANNVGLREGLASGVRLEEITEGGKFGVRIVSDGRDLPPEKQLMVYAWQAQTFRHPVYGESDVEVTQSGRPTFMSTVEASRTASTTAVQDAMVKAANVLGGHP